MAFTTAAWDETKPAGTRSPTLGDDDIREFKEQIRERLSVDHDTRSDESGAESITTPTGTIGYHVKVTLTERASDPTNVANAGILYTKDSGGISELYYEDSAGTVKQLTSNGTINIFGTDVDFGDYEVRAQTLEADVATGTAPLTITSTTVVTNLNADLLDGKHDGEVTPANSSVTAAKATALLGAWVDKSGSYGAQQAATDGFVVGWFEANANGPAYYAAYTDSNADPTTIRQKGGVESSGDTGSDINAFTIPVKKGDYWKIVLTGGSATATVYWIPLGS